MNSAAKLLVPILVVAALAAGYFALTSEDVDPFREVDQPPTQTQPGDPVDENASTMTAKSTPPRTDAGTRTDVTNQPQAEPESYAQGIRGRVVDPRNAPVRNATVYLMEGAGLDLFKMMQQVQRGVVLAPIATATTDNAGRFALGVANPNPNQDLELRIPHDQFVEHTVQRLRVRANEWVNQEIKLRKGVQLKGRVSIAGGSGTPVPGATVSVEANGVMPSISPTPGRENGIETKADANGFYQFENIPQGIVTVSAVAPSFARVTKQNTAINPETENRVDFELERGLEIIGVVVNADGMPVSGARVEAMSISNKTPANGKARTGRDGRFEILGLLDGPYMLTAVATGYVRTEKKPIQAGDKEVQMVMENQGTARLQVFDKNNRLASSFRVTVKRYFEGQEHFGNTDIPTRQGRHGGEGYFEVGGLDPDSYVFQVEANNHAKAYSGHFKVVIGEEPPLVQVRLTEGGVLAGQITGADNQPLAGAEVETLPDSYQDNPLMTMLGGLMPMKITRTKVRTDAKGRYWIALLNPGIYQLKFTHPSHYDISLRGNQVTDGQTLNVPAARMKAGTAVSGVARVDGQPKGQVKVTISTIPEPIDPNKPQDNFTMQSTFTAECYSNEKGQFVFSRRVPPGRYHVMAGRQDMANILMQIADFASTKKEVVLNGQKKFFVQFNIPSSGN